jgi:archaemetzincin
MTENRLGLTAVLLAAALSCPTFCACGAEGAKDQELPPPFDKLVRLHEPIGKPQPGDWLAEHPESGQTYARYLKSKPVRPTKERGTLYVQPLGSFTDTQRKIVRRTAEYMQCHFGVPVKVRDDLPLSVIPEQVRRKHPTWGMEQILSTYVLDSVLSPRLPDDALAYIAFTSSDLWPGEGWNFVFGQASLQGRVGVWSLYRYGDPDESKEAYQLCLKRTIKVGIHETGHMISIPHCTAFRCNMAGSNHLAEMDRKPLWLCPVCLAKLCWATGVDPAARFERLAVFCRDNGLTEEQAFFEKSLRVIAGSTRK